MFKAELFFSPICNDNLSTKKSNNKKYDVVNTFLLLIKKYSFLAIFQFTSCFKLDYWQNNLTSFFNIPLKHCTLLLRSSGSMFLLNLPCNCSSDCTAAQINGSSIFNFKSLFIHGKKESSYMQLVRANCNKYNNN